jgi:energy-coupling factor transporter ATP-binding protein EcfA2
VIEVQHLTKRYGPVTAVDDVSFKAERGEILGVLGPNGAGKTTTMRVLTGYMPATDGKAIVAGYDVLEQPVEAKRRTGYLPETPPLYPDMTVEDYLAFCARIKGVARSERTSRLQSVMEKTQIADMRNRHCGKLSKGYKQRVGLAQALLHNPDVLILDEPTAHQGTRRRPHDHPQHAHPSRGQPDLQSHRHHQSRKSRRGRHARQPDRPRARVGIDVRAGGRDGRRRRRDVVIDSRRHQRISVGQA